MKWNCRHLLLHYSAPSEFKGEISNYKCLLHVIIPISSVWSWDTRLNSTDVIDWSILQLLSVFVIKQHLPAHWTYSGLHLDIVLWNHSKLFSLLYLQFYSLHLILTTQTPNGIGTQRVKHFYCFYNQNGCFDSYCKFKWLHSSPLRNEKYQHIRPVSCSFFNTWYNLSRPDEVSVINAQGTPTKKKIPEGNYSLKSLGQAL